MRVKTMLSAFIICFSGTSAYGGLTAQPASSFPLIPAHSCGAINGKSVRLPTGMRFNASQEAAQRTLAVTLAAQIQTSLASGKSFLAPKNAHLRFKPTPTDPRNPSAKWNSWLQISGRNGTAQTPIVLDFNGATLWLEDNASGGYSADALFISSSSNITIKNLTIDYDPLPFTQGVVQEIVPEANNKAKVRIRLDEDFREVAPSFAAKQPTDASGNVVREGTTAYSFDPLTCKVKAKQPLGAPQFANFFRQSGGLDKNGVALVDFGADYGTIKSQFLPGDRVALGARHKPPINIDKGNNITLENVNIYAFALPAIYDIQAEGKNVYNHVTIAPRPDTTRLVAGVADGIHVSSAKLGPDILNSKFDSMMDDAINVHGSFSPVLLAVTGKDSSGRYLTTNTRNGKTITTDKIVVLNKGVIPIAANLPRGSGQDIAISLYTRAPSPTPDDPSDFAYVTAARIRAVESGASGIFVPNVTDAGWNDWWLKKNEKLKANASYETLVLTLERPIAITNPMVAVIDRKGYGANVSGNTFRNMAVRGVVMQTTSATVANNTFDWVRSAGIFAGSLNPYSWNEASMARDIRAPGNAFNCTGEGYTRKLLAEGKSVTIDPTHAAVTLGTQAKQPIDALNAGLLPDVGAQFRLVAPVSTGATVLSTSHCLQ